MKNGQVVNMHCPKCNDKKLKVIDSRDRELHANSLIRRRECTACGYRFNTKEKIKQLQTTQLAILTNGAALLKLGGRLCYSTCSIEPEENHKLVEQWLKNHPEFQLLQTNLLIPGQHGTDGGFAALLQKIM